MLQWVSFGMLVAGLAGVAIASEPEVDPKQLPRVLPTAPREALATFHLKPGFRIELAACEPLVVDPIALSFDEDGRLYVVEMRDYSERRPERLGRIRLLEDTDDDGRFDRSTVFAHDLPWPTAVICWDGGVFVGATPDLLYFKDTDGDGVADVREVLYTGFAADYAPFQTNRLNVQALMNSFQWGLNNRIHGATSFSGGKVRLVDTAFVREWLRRGGAPPSADGKVRGESDPAPAPKATLSAQLSTTHSPLDLRGRDFSFDPRTLEMRAESGGGQHGLSFDNGGRKYVCSNSSHIQTLMYEERYAARHPSFTMPRALVDIAVDGGAAPVYRLSPDEPWRVLRTQWRVAGLVPGPVEGGGRPSGYFTGATGITIYRGDAFGDDFMGDAFVGDAGGNLVHRKKIRPDGVGVLAERPADEQEIEFLASTDNWFRPVQLANGPDGALYICDMYREVIEHPWSLPDSLKKHLDLNSGNDRGRIYRVVPTDFRRAKSARLSQATTGALVEALESPNGWRRDTAARLIYQRQDPSAVPNLEKLLERGRGPDLRRVHALHALAGLKSLQEKQVADALSDPRMEVRENALKLAEPFLARPSENLWKAIRSQAETTVVRSSDLQLAFTLGEASRSNRIEVASTFLSTRSAPSPVLRERLVQNHAMTWLEDAWISGLDGVAFSVFSKVVNQAPGKAFPREAGFLAKLARQIGCEKNAREIAEVLQVATNLVQQRAGFDLALPPNPLLGFEIIFNLDQGLRQSRSSLQRIGRTPDLKPFYSFVASTVTNRAQAEKTRLAAIRALSTASYSEARPSLLRVFVDGLDSATVQRAAVAALGRYSDAGVAQDLLHLWPSLTPALRAEALSSLLQRTARIEALLSAIEEGAVQLSELSFAQRDWLRGQANERLRRRALDILGHLTSPSRTEAIAAFQASLALPGDGGRGQKIFIERCASCHRIGHAGYALGPDLATVRAAGKEKVLINILDPNREVAVNFAAYAIETKEGDSFSGIVVNEAPASITLRQANGIETVVTRSNILSMQSQGKSLMPEGLEAGLNQQDMADLLEYVVNQTGGK